MGVWVGVWGNGVNCIGYINKYEKNNILKINGGDKEKRVIYLLYWQKGNLAKKTKNKKQKKKNNFKYNIILITLIILIFKSIVVFIYIFVV